MELLDNGTASRVETAFASGLAGDSKLSTTLLQSVRKLTWPEEVSVPDLATASADADSGGDGCRRHILKLSFIGT